MDFCNWYTVNEKYLQHGLSQINCMDISTENLVKMDNKRNNLIQHTLIGDHVSKNGIKAMKEIDTYEAYNILWKSFQFLKGLGELQKVYKKLKNEPNLDKKVDFLKTKDKLMREKPLKVMGLKVSYSDTSLSISEEDQLPPFKKALLTDTLPTELKDKSKCIKKNPNIKKKEIPEPMQQTIEEEPKDLEAPIVNLGRTTLNKKDYEKSKKKKIAELRKLFPDPPKIIKKIVTKAEQESNLEDMYPEPEEQTLIEEALAEEEEPVIEEVKKIKKPPKPKKRIIKKVRKKEPPKEEPKPPSFKLRQLLPTDKRRVSDSDTKKKPEGHRGRKRRWSYSYGAGSSMSSIKLDKSPLKIKLPKPTSSITSLTSGFDKNSQKVGKLRRIDSKKEQQRKQKTVGKLKLPDAFAGR